MVEKVAIVNSSSFGKYFPEHVSKLEERLEVVRVNVPSAMRGAELAERLRGFKYLIVSTSPVFDREFFENVEGLVLVSRHGIGYDNIDVGAATERGVLVTKVLGATEREAVAEHAVALCMAVLRRVVSSTEAVKNGRWSERHHFFGFELKGRTVGVIGFGNIGSRVGEIVARGFGADVVAYDPKISVSSAEGSGVRMVELDELLENSDVIFVCAAHTGENYHMLSDAEFGKMKNGVVIVNTSRGELVDGGALVRALESGKVGGYGADVVEGEPIDGEHPLLRFENVVITPHIAAYTYECLKGMGDKVVDDVLRASEMVIPDGVVNAEVIGRLEKAGWRRARVSGD